ncbi:MAG: hypothetical protein Q7J69_00725 [Candidatus Omnitrophota bacterium]|nr:hypothetical protein [Candidatus Omnitrophota bacterium]
MKKKNVVWLSGLLAVALGVMSPAIVRADEPVLGSNPEMLQEGMDLANAAIADAILNQAMQQLDAMAAAIQFVAGPSASLVTAPVGSIANTAALINNPALITGIASVASNIIAPPPPAPPILPDAAPVPVGVTPPPPPVPTIANTPPLFLPGPSSPGPGEPPFDPMPPPPVTPPAPPVETPITPPPPPVE